MPLKTAIVTEIQSKLSGNGSVTTWADHEDILFDDTDSILSELYKTSAVTDTQSTTTVLTTTGANRNYTISIKKQGGYVVMSGLVFYSGGGILSSDFAWATVTNSEYEPSANTYFLGYTTYFGEPIRMSLFDNGGTWELRTVDSVANLETVSFNITYFVGA